MSTDKVHPSTIDTDTKLEMTEPSDDPALPPQQHAGAAGIGPNYPLGPSLGDKIGGVVEEIKGKIMRKPGVVEHGRELRTGELKRKEWEQDLAPDA